MNGETPLIEADRNNNERWIIVLFWVENFNYLHKSKKGEDTLIIIQKYCSSRYKRIEEIFSFFLWWETEIAQTLWRKFEILTKETRHCLQITNSSERSRRIRTKNEKLAAQQRKNWYSTPRPKNKLLKM